MKFVSTRGNETATGAEAIVKGLASDGGLFVPETFPLVTADEIAQMTGMNYAERAAYIIGKYLGEFGEEFLKDACASAYSAFEGKDPAPLVRIDEGLYILELFHGPTCAFKDMALSLLPRLLKRACELTGDKEEILILAATSGDTGKAALEGFRDAPGVKVAVLYPDEGVSKMQRLQMCTQDGGNVFVAGVKGNFDDCQRAVKKLFVSGEFNEQLRARNIRLSSANSINFGRLVPQIAYYFPPMRTCFLPNRFSRGTRSILRFLRETSGIFSRAGTPKNGASHLQTDLRFQSKPRGGGIFPHGRIQRPAPVLPHHVPVDGHSRLLQPRTPAL